MKTSLHIKPKLQDQPCISCDCCCLSKTSFFRVHTDPLDRSQSLFYFVPRSDSHSQAGSTTVTSYQPLRLTLPSWKQNKHSDVLTKSFWTNKHTHILSLLSSYLYLFWFWQVENDPWSSAELPQTHVTSLTIDQNDEETWHRQRQRPRRIFINAGMLWTNKHTVFTFVVS